MSCKTNFLRPSRASGLREKNFFGVAGKKKNGLRDQVRGCGRPAVDGGEDGALAAVRRGRRRRRETLAERGEVLGYASSRATPPAMLTQLNGVVQGSRLGREIDVSTSGTVQDTLRRFKECRRHFLTLGRVF